MTGSVVLLFGLSGAGKSTICHAVADTLRQSDYSVCILDGDVVRNTISLDLGFTLADRTENVRRVAHRAVEMAQCYSVVLVALICPLECMRRLFAAIVPRTIEVFVDAPLSTCEARDPKGLYARARASTINNFTGISSPFELPRAPDVVCNTLEPVEICTALVIRALQQDSTIPSST